MSFVQEDRQKGMSDLVVMREPFDALVGAWRTQVTHPVVDAVSPGTVTLKWSR